MLRNVFPRLRTCETGTWRVTNQIIIKATDRCLSICCVLILRCFCLCNKANSRGDRPPPKTVLVSFTVCDMTQSASCSDRSASSRICWVAPRRTIEHASPRATPAVANKPITVSRHQTGNSNVSPAYYTLLPTNHAQHAVSGQYLQDCLHWSSFNIPWETVLLLLLLDTQKAIKTNHLQMQSGYIFGDAEKVWLDAYAM